MMVPERRYAAWHGAYRGAPTPVGTYYFITLFCVCAAASLRFLPNLSSIVIVPFNMAGVIFRLYKPVIRRRVGPMRDLPAASPQYSARISLSRGTIYGTDEGLVSFVDGWLLFVGAGCTFSFRACDVLVSPAESKLTFAAPSQTHALVF